MFPVQFWFSCRAEKTTAAVLMAYQRLQALDGYLSQLQGAANFNKLVEEQCVSLVTEIRSLDRLEIQEATPLLAMVQQCAHWTDQHRQTLLQVIHEKVEVTINGKTVKARMQLQDYLNFPLYLTEQDWRAVMDRSLHVPQKMSAVMPRLYPLGLRHGSEPTYAMVTAVMLLTEPERLSDFQQLRSSYLYIKKLAKDFLGAQEHNASPTLRTLPSLVGALPEEVKLAAYGEGEDLGQFPQGVTMEGLRQIENMISKRGNNKNLELFPKASRQIMMNAMGLNPALLGLSQMASVQMQQFRHETLPGAGCQIYL